jgi:hypothetical protein
MTLKVKPQSAAFLGLLGVVGALLIIVGASFDSKTHAFWVNVFAAIGAAIMGTALSLFIARVFEPAPIDDIYHLLSVAKNFSLITDDDKVRPRRLKYHGYLLSHALGKPQWKYRVFDFTQDRRPGYLHARVDVWVPTESNQDKQYPGHTAEPHPRDSGEPDRIGHQVFLYNGYLCDPYHLILVGRLDPEYGTEPEVIHIFPFGLKVQGNVMAGLAFLETSDNKHVVTPTILSKTRLTAETIYGPVAATSDQAKLSTIWKQHFLGDFQINIPCESFTEHEAPHKHLPAHTPNDHTGRAGGV